MLRNNLQMNEEMVMKNNSFLPLILLHLHCNIARSTKTKTSEQ